ncbi:MAG: GerMN domain-containing protein [Chlorobi bacterium]|nr:GerMN domain-containing protein [Chlorobiota bacterium]
MQRLSVILLTGIAMLSCGTSEDRKQPEQPHDGTDSPSLDTLQSSKRQGPIIVESPRSGAILSRSEFTIRGTARTFEGTVLYRLVYGSVLNVASGFITADSAEIGTYSPFSIDVTYSSDFGGDAILEVYEEDAESGEEVNKVKIPVTIVGLPGKEKQKVFVYFPNIRMGSRRDCRSVYPLSRELPKESKGLARGAIYYLLKELDEEERIEGYRNKMPEGLRLNRISIEDGVAHLDFSSHLNRIKRACDAQMVRAQIEQTLAQFQTVNAVAITADGMNWTMGR